MSALLLTLNDAAQDQGVVTITTVEGRILTGPIRPHPTEPGAYAIRLLWSGQDVTVHADDVAAVVFE